MWELCQQELLGFFNMLLPISVIILFFNLVSAILFDKH